MAREIGQVAYGKEAAGSHPHFIAGYRLVVTERGKFVEGSSPDGRQDFGCMRCGKDLHNVLVFANRERTSFMHVGIDCAGVMGIPAEELRKAGNYWKDLEREKSRAENAKRYAAERAERASREAANLSAAAQLVAELESLASDPNATDYEHTVIRQALGLCASNGTDWYVSEWLVEAALANASGKPLDGAARASAALDAVRDRLALCRTSKPVAGKAITGAFRAYRPHIVLKDYGYGESTISFLTDDKGTAFVIKSANFVLRHGCTVVGTFSVGDTEERDGLTATRLLRPHKIATDCFMDPYTGWSVGLVEKKHLYV